MENNKLYELAIIAMLIMGAVALMALMTQCGQHELDSRTLQQMSQEMAKSRQNQSQLQDVK